MSISGRIRRHTWRRVLTGPMVMLFGAASVATTAALALGDWRWGLLGLVPVAAASYTLTGIAALGRYVSKRGRFHREALKKARRELVLDGPASLEVLREFLMLTGDRELGKQADALLRIETRLQTLRDAPPDALNVTTHATLGQLRDAAVGLLIKAAQLKEHAKQLVRPESRHQVQQLRDELVDSARDSVVRLDETLDQLQVNSLKQDLRSGDDPAPLQQELDQQLELARRVDARIDAFDGEVRGAERTAV